MIIQKQIRSRLFLVFISALFLNSGALVNLSAQPSGIHLSIDTRKTYGSAAPVSVTWSSDRTAGNQFVKYGLTPQTQMVAKARKSDLNGNLVLHSKLKKLKRGTKYYYKCGSDETGWSPVFSFTSEPDSGRFRVAIIGDTQDNSKNESFTRTREVTSLVRIYSPSLTLHMGDIVDNGSVADGWEGFLAASQELNAVSPLMPVLGNHDVQNNPGNDFQKPFQDFYSLFDLPGDEVNYAFTYNNTRFIGIFSGCAEAAAKNGKVKYAPGSEEYKWLDSELSKAEKDKSIRWVVVWMHYPVLSFGWSNISKWKENVLPLLERHKVDLCLAGHRHVYERHLQIENGVPVKNNSKVSFPAGKGTIYVTNGTAGGNPTGLGGKDLPTLAFTPERIMYSFAIMDINSRSITYRVFDKDNLLIDWFTISR